MENENKYKDWHLQRLYVVLFFNALLWFSFFALFKMDNETLSFLIASAVIGVTSCWMFISHIIICRKKLALKPMAALYALPLIFMLALLPILASVQPQSGTASPDGKYVFKAKRGANFWTLEFKNSESLTLELQEKIIPANKHLSWKWDNNTLWIYSKLDKIYYAFRCENDEINYFAWNDKMPQKPPAGLKN